MQVTVIGRHMDIPPELRDYVEQKLDKLPRFYDRVMMIEVIVEHDQNQNSVEIVVSVAKHREFVAQESGDELYASFDMPERCPPSNRCMLQKQCQSCYLELVPMSAHQRHER